MKNSPYTGSCLCGLIKYEVDEIGSKIGHCHCSMCRKFHGSAFATIAEARVEHFRWVAGESSLASYEAENGTVRKFCSQCGASMTFAPSVDMGELIEFSLGTLDSKSEFKLELVPDAHIFVGSKASWFDVSDDLPQFDAGRNSKRID
jgi:hypothetical protein